MVQAAKDCGATAIHPGYGFLSESPEFVAEVEAAGVVWLGPAAATIRDFALKHVAKDMAVEAGVPTLSGSPLVSTEEGTVLAASVGCLSLYFQAELGTRTEFSGHCPQTQIEIF